MDRLDDVAKEIGRTTFASTATAERELRRLTAAGVSLELADRAFRLGITIDHVRALEPNFGHTP